MLLVMTALGGATRLTGSGLSIMEWAPLRGALPPVSDTEWQRLFRLYQQIPQYSLVHDGFGIEGFKRIFWLEYLHRLWGRLIGLGFLLPLLWFWVRGFFSPIPGLAQELRRLRLRLLGLFLLGGAQGGVGWLMVASGFAADSIAVSPYRLVVHLMLALSLYAAIFWIGLSLLNPSPAPAPGPDARLTRRLLIATCLLATLTILAGGFVAGTHAGLDYNSFPLMDGHLVPAGYGRLDPFWLNLTENIAAVQFDHRLLATVTAIVSVAAIASGLASPRLRDRLYVSRLRGRFYVLGVTVALQYALGVATLLTVPRLGHLPVGFGTAHQVMAVGMLTAALAALHPLCGARCAVPAGLIPDRDTT